jgi:hypothetical protein
MRYTIGELPRDEAIAQLARNYLHDVGEEKTMQRIRQYERLAAECSVPTYAESYARHAEALRDAVENKKEIKAA